MTPRRRCRFDPHLTPKSTARPRRGSAQYGPEGTARFRGTHAPTTATTPSMARRPLLRSCDSKARGSKGRSATLAVDFERQAHLHLLHAEALRASNRAYHQVEGPEVGPIGATENVVTVVASLTNSSRPIARGLQPARRRKAPLLVELQLSICLKESQPVDGSAEETWFTDWTSHPVASMHTRPCLSSAARYQRSCSSLMPLVNPAGSKNLNTCAPTLRWRFRVESAAAAARGERTRREAARRPSMRRRAWRRSYHTSAAHR